MLSNKCLIEEFVEKLNSKSPWEVVATAIDEATQAERHVYKMSQDTEKMLYVNYANQLKQLINYHRFAIKPKRANNKVYNLYMTYWGATEQKPMDCVP